MTEWWKIRSKMAAVDTGSPRNPAHSSSSMLDVKIRGLFWLYLWSITLKRRCASFIICSSKRKSKWLDFRLELQIVKEAHLLFKVIDQRYSASKPLIFTTNIEEIDWPEFLGDAISSEAILDRIFHHSVIVRIKGPSYRKYQGELLQKKYKLPKDVKTEKPETG